MTEALDIYQAVYCAHCGCALAKSETRTCEHCKCDVCISCWDGDSGVECAEKATDD